MGDITLKKDGLMMATITAVRLIAPRQGGVVTDRRRDSVQYIPNLLLSFVPIHQWFVRSVFDVTTESTRVAQGTGAFVFLRTNFCFV